MQKKGRRSCCKVVGGLACIPCMVMIFGGCCNQRAVRKLPQGSCACYAGCINAQKATSRPTVASFKLLSLCTRAWPFENPCRISVRTACLSTYLWNASLGVGVKGQPQQLRSIVLLHLQQEFDRDAATSRQDLAFALLHQGQNQCRVALPRLSPAASTV